METPRKCAVCQIEEGQEHLRGTYKGNRVYQYCNSNGDVHNAYTGEYITSKYDGFIDNLTSFIAFAKLNKNLVCQYCVARLKPKKPKPTPLF